MIGETSSFETVSCGDESPDPIIELRLPGGVINLANLTEAQRSRAKEETETIRQQIHTDITQATLLEAVLEEREKGKQSITLRLSRYCADSRYNHTIDYRAIYEETMRPLLLSLLDPQMFHVTGRHLTEFHDGRDDYEVKIRWLEPDNSIWYRVLCFPMGC